MNLFGFPNKMAAYVSVVAASEHHLRIGYQASLQRDRGVTRDVPADGMISVGSHLKRTIFKGGGDNFWNFPWCRRKDTTPAEIVPRIQLTFETFGFIANQDDDLVI